MCDHEIPLKPSMKLRDRIELITKVAKPVFVTIVLLIGVILLFSSLICALAAVYAPESDLARGFVYGLSKGWSAIWEPPIVLIQGMVVRWYPALLFLFGFLLLDRLSAIANRRS